MSIKKTGPSRWRVTARVRRDGRIMHKQRTIEGTKETAKGLFEQFKADLRGGAGSGSLKFIGTFGELCTFFIERNDVGKSMPYFRRLKEDLGSVYIEALAVRFDSYLQLLKVSKGRRTHRQLAVGTRNRFIAWAKRVCNFGVLHGRIKENPLRHFRLEREKPRKRILSDEEKERLLSAVEMKAPYLLPAVQFALQIPCRTGEIVKARREHLNLFKNVIQIPGELTKNGHGVTKAIPPSMLPYFRALPRESDYLFYRQKKNVYHSLGDFKHAWHTVTKAAGLEGLRFHDLRHAAVTALRNRGTPDHVIHKLAGWKHGDFMMRIYYDFEDEKIFKLIRWEDKCDSVVIASEAGSV